MRAPFLVLPELLRPREFTADYSVLLTDVGDFFTTHGATGLVTFSLPSSLKSMLYFFENDAVSGLRLSATGGNKIRMGPTVSSSNGSMTATDLGAVVAVFAPWDAADWRVLLVTPPASWSFA